MKALIIGGRGLMGRWFCSYLESMGHEVITVDPAGPTKGFPRAASIEAGLEGLGRHDVVLVCAPMERAGSLLGQVRRAGTKALVADICSIKARVRPELLHLARKGFKVASLHPMWGPDAVLLSDKNLLVLDCGSRAAVREAKALFAGSAVRVRELPLAEHDRLMSWALGLPHAVNLAFSAALRGSGIAPGELERLGGPTMRNQLHIARGVARENKDLYYGIQAYNQRTPEVQAALLKALRDLQRALRTPSEFKAFMAACEAFYDAPPAARPRRRRKA